MKKVIIESTRRVFDDFFKIDEAYLRFEQLDGRMSPVVRRLNFERGDSVAAVVFKPKTGRVVLVNQFKYPTLHKGPGWLTEVVAGVIDPGESAEVAARREILEEIGYQVTTLEHICTFYVSPGGTSERVILYYAEVDEDDKRGPGGGLVAEHEDIAVVEMTVDESMKQVEDGEIADAKTIVGIMWLSSRLRAA
jgi:nudix-type nucleoside diphosphatase (YffH/AdpP family)